LDYAGFAVGLRDMLETGSVGAAFGCLRAHNVRPYENPALCRGKHCLPACTSVRIVGADGNPPVVGGTITIVPYLIT